MKKRFKLNAQDLNDTEYIPTELEMEVTIEITYMI